MLIAGAKVKELASLTDVEADDASWDVYCTLGRIHGGTSTLILCMDHA